MADKVVSDREYWHGVLSRSASTPLPRWSLAPRGDLAVHGEILSDALETALHRLSNELGIPLRTILLGAVAKVVSELTGESAVTIGYKAQQGNQPLPCVVTTEPVSWRELLLDVRRSEIELISHQDSPLSELAQELGLTEPAIDVVFDVVSTAAIPETAILQVGVSRRSEPLTLRFQYRAEALDASHVGRIAGYHLQVLTLMVEDVDQSHSAQGLLSANEIALQLEGLAGPRRPLPELRAHELFEQQVAARPHAIAAIHGEQHVSYQALNSRANQIARALQARGVGRETIVAVVTERNVDWMAAVLAIFKAGCVYLPIEPHFPSDRIATTLWRADCNLVLTEARSTTTLDPALDSLPGVQKLAIEDAYQENHRDGDLGLDIAEHQLAYIYFTSGSTGEPKGAMCEHAGLLNHLFAKIDDLGISEDQVVAQTAPQCFDISLWQLIASLMVGGRTLIVEQDVILDVERWVDKIVEQRVAVLQIVPSYLEAVLSQLEQRPRELPDLRVVSVTGEALKRELVQRWFTLKPEIKLVNAYGLTETSDDTNHEVMVTAPDSRGVPLGRPINNVYVYVVDDQLEFVPLGAPGEIVFSGVCVGRGYINDPERTRIAFMRDPHREGERLYRSGDFGRWRPDGKLEFLGRRDNQVKISGFRIEIDEIENRLLQVEGIDAGAVVVAQQADQAKHLVSFYSAAREVDADDIRSSLKQALPAYMVPTTFHWLAKLPLTDNGKVDRKELVSRAGELRVADVDTDVPVTPNEQRLANAWAKVLGIPEDHIGRHDHFFDRGGTSLSAVKLAIALDRAVSHNDVAKYPVLADQAALLVPHE